MPGSSIFDLDGKLRIDLSQLEALSPELAAQVESVNGRTATMRVRVDNTQSQTAMAALSAKANEVRAKLQSRTTVRVDTAGAKDSLTELQRWFAGQMRQVDSSIAQTEGRLRQLGGSVPSNKGGSSSTGQGAGDMMQGVVAMGGMVLGGMGIKRMVSTGLEASTSEARMEAQTRRVFGGGGEEMINYLQGLSKATKYLDDDLYQAALEMGDAGDNFGISADQIKESVARITDVAHTSGLPQYRDDINAVTQALVMGMQGNARGLKKLGIQVDETYMQTQALNGAFKDTWDTMDAGSQAQGRLNSILEQLSDIADEASTDTESYAYTARASAQQVHEAFQKLGDAIQPIAKFINSTIGKMPTSVITGGIVGAGLLGTAFMGAGMFGMTRGMVRGAKSGEGLFGEMFGKSLAKEAADAAGSLKTAAVEAASTTTTAAATSATATTTAAGTAAATTEGGATAAAVTTEGGAAGSAVTIEGGAGAAAGTLEGAAIGAGATTEGAAAVAAKTLEAGASAAAAELRAGGAGGFDGWSKNATGRTLTMPEKWQLAREAEASKGLLGGSGLQKAATAGGTSASILGGSFAAQLAGGLVLALPAAVAAGLALWYGSNAVKNAEAEDAAAKHRYDLNAIRVAKLTGMGDASNPDQAEYVGTYTNQYGMVFNARGQRLASYAEEWQIGSRQAQMNQRSQNLQMVNDLIRQQERHVRIILQDQTVSGVKASQIDTRSNSPNAF